MIFKNVTIIYKVKMSQKTDWIKIYQNGSEINILKSSISMIERDSNTNDTYKIHNGIKEFTITRQHNNSCFDEIDTLFRYMKWK
jgi:hypothetical protein